MKKTFILKTYNIFHKILLIILLILLTKLVLDFYNKNKNINSQIKNINSKINKEILYNSYNTFYNLSNMLFVVCGDFVPEEILQEI